MEQTSGSPAERRWIYATLVGVFCLLAVVVAAGKALMTGQPFNLVTADGQFYYAYLPSVVIDGDLDFSNQIREHWGPDFRPALLDDRTATGQVRNKYPVGLALTLLPGFLLGHLVSLCSGGLFPADGYSIPYQLSCLAVIQFLVWRTLVRADRLMTERLRIPADATLFGLMVLAAGTQYAYYAFREPFMVHAVSGFWCMEVVALASARLSRTRVAVSPAGVLRGHGRGLPADECPLAPRDRLWRDPGRWLRGLATNAGKSPPGQHCPGADRPAIAELARALWAMGLFQLR